MIKLGDDLIFNSGFKLLSIFCFFSIVLLSTFGFAQTDPNDPTSPNYRGKSKTYQKKYFASFGATVGQGFDEFSEAFGVYSFSGSYALDKSSITTNIEYSNPLDGDTADVAPWRFEDVEFVWNAPSLKPIILGGKTVTFSPRVIYRAPVSDTARNAFSYGTLIGTLIGSLSEGRFTFIVSPSINLSYHEFDTANKAGTIKNIPLAGSIAATVRVTLVKNLFLTGSAFFYNGWDYDFNQIPVNGASSNIYYQVNPKLGLTAYVSWRDRVLTNNSLFDDETSNMGLGFITNF